MSSSRPISRVEALFSPRESRVSKATLDRSSKKGLFGVDTIKVVSPTNYITYLDEYKKLHTKYYYEENNEKLKALERCFLMVIVNPKLPMGRSELTVDHIKRIHRKQRRGYSFFCMTEIKDTVRIKRDDNLLVDVRKALDKYRRT